MKEKNNSDSPSSTNNTNSNNISNNNKITENQNNLDNIFDLNSLSFCAPQDNFNLNETENENSPNFLTKIHAKYLKEKTKNNNNLINKDIHDFKFNKMDIEKHNEKNKITIDEIEKKDEDEENYLFTNKADNEIIDDINFFKNNENIKKKEINNKYFGKDYEIKKNIMCVDENEEEKIENNNIINNEEDDDDWSVNKSHNIVGVVCPSMSRNSSFSSNKANKKNKKKNENNSSFSSNQLKKNDSNRGNDYLFY